MADPAGVIALVASAALYAREVYKKCRACPGEYQTLCSDTQQLANILEDLEGLAEEHPITGGRGQEFKDRAAACQTLLAEMSEEVDRFNSLGTSSRRTWDRLNWDKERVVDLRLRLTSNISLLSTFYQRLIMSSQIRIETALMRLLADFQSGQRGATSVSSLTMVGEDPDEEAWEDVLRDLEDVGITPQAAHENREFIIQWFRDAKDQIPGSDSTDSSSEHRMSASTAGHDRNASVGSSHLSGLVQVRSPESLRYMEPFLDYGIAVEAAVRRERNTFRDDLNRSREYWTRSAWADVKANLLRVVVGSQLPNHRRGDIDARTAVFLMAIACSNSGDFEAAKSIFKCILEPWPRQEAADASRTPDDAPCDDAQIAAATWLGDVCLKTNRIEDAAVAWAIAWDAASRRDEKNAKQRTRVISLPVTRTQSTPLGQPMASPMNARFAMRHPSLAPNHAAFSSGRSLHQRMLLSELTLTYRYTGNLDSIQEGLEAGWYPHQTENPGSIFANSDLLSSAQMIQLIDKVRNAVELADDKTALMSSYPIDNTDAAAQLLACKRQTVLKTTGPLHRQEPLVNGDDCLHSPVRHKAWPLQYDVDFSYLAALKTLEYIHLFTPLKDEGVEFNIPVLDRKISRTLASDRGKPVYVADDLKPKKLQDREKFANSIRATLHSMRFIYREAPAEFRCQPRLDLPHPRWPSVSRFALRLVGFDTGKFLGGPRLACYVADIIHWDGTRGPQTLSTKEADELITELEFALKIRHAAERGNVLPGSGPDQVSVTL